MPLSLFVVHIGMLQIYKCMYMCIYVIYVISFTLNLYICYAMLTLYNY